MATNKTTVSIYADDDLLTALNGFKDSGNHKSLNVAIVAILREKLFGDVSSTLESKVTSTLDIEAIIDSRISALRESINLEFVDIKNELAAIATSPSEATAPANFTQALLQRAKEVAPLMLRQSA